MTPILDRTLNHDLRSYDYVRDMSTIPVVARQWEPVNVLDQGSVGACTGFGSTMAVSLFPGISATDRKRLCRNAHALAVYVVATAQDTIPGMYPVKDTGSDVNTAMRVMKDLGWVGLWEFLTNAQSVAAAISTVGPVVMGTTWYNSMFATHSYTDTKDRGAQYQACVVDKASGVAGGHCFALVGVNPTRRTCTIQNSWGTGWGERGKADITWDDLDLLIADQGDAVLAHRDATYEAAHGLY